jgi:hypothetical protein
LDEVLAQLAPIIRHAAAGFAPAAVLALGAACVEDAPPTADTARQYPPGYIVDSIHPPEEALRRFRSGLDTVTQLDGPPTQRQLFDQFRRAAAAGDTAALQRLTLTRAEFAYLVYPESRLSQPPYRQPPEIAWQLLQQASNAGLTKLLQRAPAMRLLEASCPDSSQVEGRMRTVSGCAIRVQTSDNVRDLRLFGRIVELNGRWKIVGYDGDL